MNIWDIRDKELIKWWIIRDDLAEHIDQGEPIDLPTVLLYFTEALQRLDEIAKQQKQTDAR
jgi:hypothetical protein